MCDGLCHVEIMWYASIVRSVRCAHEIEINVVEFLYFYRSFGSTHLYLRYRSHKDPKNLTWNGWIRFEILLNFQDILKMRIMDLDKYLEKMICNTKVI